MRMSGNGLWALGIAALFAFTMACGEETPQGKPKSLAEKAAEKGGKKADDPADKSGDGKKTAAAGEPIKPIVAAPRVEPAAEVPQDSQVSKAMGSVAVYGVTGPLDALKEKALAAMPADIAEKAKQELEKSLGEAFSEIGLKNMDFVDTTRGIGFAIQGKERIVVAWPLKDISMLKAALPDGSAPDEHGGYLVKEEYVLPQGNLLLQAKSFEVIDGLDGEMKLELGRMSTTNLLVVVADGASLKGVLSSAMDDFERTISSQGEMQSDQREVLVKMANFVRGLVADVAKITVTLGTSDVDLTTTVEITTTEGSSLGKTFASLTGGSFQMSKYLPADSWLVAVSWLPISIYTNWVDGYGELLGAAWKLSDDDKMALKKLYAEVISFMGPDTAMAFYHEDGFPLSMTSVTSTRDGLGLRDKLLEFYDFIYRKSVNALPPSQRGMLEGKGFKDLVQGMLAPMLAQHGITIKMETEEYAGGKVDYLVFNIDWTLIPLPEELSWVKDVVKKSLGFAMASVGDKMAMTFGPNPVVRAKMVLDGVGGLTLATAVGDEALKAESAFVMALQVPVLMDSLMSLPVLQAMASPLPWIQELRKVRGLLIHASGSAKGTLTVSMKFDAKNLINALAPLIREKAGLVPGADGQAAPLGAPSREVAPEAAPAATPEAAAPAAAPAAEAAPAAAPTPAP